MSLNQYKIFRTVIDSGSFSKAAQLLGISQSAVSHAITNLENDLGFLLLSRNRSGIKLTENGARILEYIEKILYLDEKMHQEAAEIKGLELGKVTLGTFSSITKNWLPGIINRFHSLYPSIQIDVKEGTNNQILEWVEMGEVDLGFVHNITKKSKYEWLLLMHDRFYKVTKQDSLQPEAPSGTAVTNKIIIPAGYKAYIEPMLTPEIGVFLEMQDEQAILQMVQRDIGITYLPGVALAELPAKLSKTPIDDESVNFSVYLSAMMFSALSPAAEKFMATTTLWLNDNC